MIPGQGTRRRTPQLRVHAAMKIKDPAGYSGRPGAAEQTLEKMIKLARLRRSAYLRTLIKHLFSDRLPHLGALPRGPC